MDSQLARLVQWATEHPHDAEWATRYQKQIYEQFLYSCKVLAGLKPRFHPPVGQPAVRDGRPPIPLDRPGSDSDDDKLELKVPLAQSSEVGGQLVQASRPLLDVHDPDSGDEYGSGGSEMDMAGDY